ncbi:MAG: ATP-binding cassette domain-containing protein [Alphaproteobacteria bacterium]
MTHTKPLIDARGIGLAYSGKIILDHIDIDIKHREVVTIIGPNGAGKTSLLRLLLGIQAPTQGTIARHPELTIGYVPQRFNLDNLLPMAVDRLLTLTRRVPSSAIDHVLDEVKAKHLRKSPVASLSGGELQRILLARALLGTPDLLVLDEPTQGVDLAGEAEFYRLIADIRNDRGCAILLVSHDVHLVMATTDRVVCLNRHICCQGLPDAVGRHPEFLRLFGAKAAEAFAFYTHHHDHDHGLSGEVKSLNSDHGTCRHGHDVHR